MTTGNHRYATVEARQAARDAGAAVTAAGRDHRILDAVYPDDNDPARFCRHAAAALDQVRPGIADRVAPLIGPPAPRSFDGVVTALINAIAAQPGDGGILLFLDDYNLIGSQRVHESVAFLIDHLPAGLRLILASRADPPLGLARLRASAQLAELHAADLRFTPEEAAALLRLAAGEDLPDTATAALTARTEGWAAGLLLAGLSLQGDVAAAQRWIRERGIRAEDVPAFELKPAEPQAAAAILGLAEPLTSREQQVLRLLAAGRANRDIAAELVVTLDTVKRHVTHILAKLCAVNRTEAVARARELNLIP